MAHIPKSKYVGNHGGAYTDIDGMSKQFTYVDHDKHTTRLTSWDYSMKQYEKTKLEELIETIDREKVNELPSFIKAFDTELAQKYDYERFKKGLPVLTIQMNKPYESEEWYNDLKQLYEKLQTKPTGENI